MVADTMFKSAAAQREAEKRRLSWNDYRGYVELWRDWERSAELEQQRGVEKAGGDFSARNRNQEPISRQGMAYTEGKKRSTTNSKLHHGVGTRHRALCRIQLLPVTIF